MPVDFFSGDPASALLGPLDQLLLEAPDDSCRWNGFPIYVTAQPYQGSGGTVEVTTRQLEAYTTPIPAGGSPTESQWPYVYLDDPYGHVHAGDTLEIDFSCRMSGSGTVRISDQYNGVIWSANLTPGPNGYVNQAAVTPDCAQIGCPNGPLQAIMSFAPFNPLVPVTVGNGYLTVRWVGGGTPLTSVYFPCEKFFLAYGPPGCGSESKQLDAFNDDTASPPTEDWTNSVVVGDGGLQGNGAFPNSGIVPVGSYGSAWWSKTRFGLGQEAYLIETPPSVPTGTEAVYLFVGLENPGAAGVNGYMLKGTETDASIYRIDAGVATLLDTFTLDPPLTGIPDGTAWGFRLTRAEAGNFIIAGYTKPGSSATDVFSFLGAVVDATYTDPGYIGMALDSGGGIVRIFGGGDIGAPFRGLNIVLTTNSCGVVTTTWDAIKSVIDSMNVAGTCPIIATVLGTHHGDAAVPQQTGLEGAVCAGTVGTTPAGGDPLGSS